VWGMDIAPQSHYPYEFWQGDAMAYLQWMAGRELREAIPPAYTEYIGKVMLDARG